MEKSLPDLSEKQRSAIADQVIERWSELKQYKVENAETIDERRRSESLAKATENLPAIKTPANKEPEPVSKGNEEAPVSDPAKQYDDVIAEINKQIEVDPRLIGHCRKMQGGVG